MQAGDGAGGGGAGGLEKKSQYSFLYSSPFRSCAGITSYSTAYPITVGGGGAWYTGLAKWWIKVKFNFFNNNISRWWMVVRIMVHHVTGGPGGSGGGG